MYIKRDHQRPPTLDDICLVHGLIAKSSKSLSKNSQVLFSENSKGKSILKIVKKDGGTSFVKQNSNTLKIIQKWSNSNIWLKFTMPKIDRTVEWRDSYSTSTEYRLLKKFKPLNFNDIVTLIDAIKEFHQKTAPDLPSFGVQPWNNYSPAYIDALKKNNKWLEVQRFLESRVPVNALKCINHNDLYKGNIFTNGSQLCILDYDGCVVDSPLNDLGIIVANYILTLELSDEGLLELLSKILKSYGIESEISNIRDLLIYTMRKLYKIEGFYLRFLDDNSDESSKIIETTVRHQLKVNRLLGKFDE